MTFEIKAVELKMAGEERQDGIELIAAADCAMQEKQIRFAHFIWCDGHNVDKVWRDQPRPFIDIVFSTIIPIDKPHVKPDKGKRRSLS